MKRFFILTAFLSALAGCQSVDSNVTDISPEAHGRESLKAIEFSIRDTSATKGPTPITSLSEFNVSATTGSAGSETSKLSNVVFENKSGVFRSDATWPSSDPGYHFYASNVAMTHMASGQTVKISTIDKDVVCAYLASPAYKVKNDLTFNHILARVGTVSFTNLDICSNVRLSMKYSGSGTYNLRTGAWSSVGSQSTKELTTSDNDFWIIPGTYDATLTYNDANGNPQSKTLSKEFKAGMVNNISAKLDGSVVVKTEDEYEAPTFTLGTISDVPAGGGDSGTPSVTSIGQRKRVKKTLADGTEKYDDWTAVSSPNYTIQYGKTLASLSDNCPSYHGDNLGTTAKALTKLGSIYVRVTANGKSADQSIDVYQAENYIKNNTVSLSNSSINVGTSCTVTYNGVWSSGSAVTGYWSSDNSSVASVSGFSKTVTVTGKGVGDTWINFNPDGGGQCYARIYVIGPTVTSYGTPTVTLSYPGPGPIAYNSTSSVSPTITVKQVYYYSDGTSPEVTLSSSDYSVSYSGSASGFRLDSDSGRVTPDNNTGNVTPGSTTYGEIQNLRFSYNDIDVSGGSSSPKISYLQSKTVVTDARTLTGSRSITIKAIVTAHGKTGSDSKTVTQNGDPGQTSTTTSSTVTSGASITYTSVSGSSALSLSSGTVSAGSNAGNGGGTEYGTPVVTFSPSSTTFPLEGATYTLSGVSFTQTETVKGRSSTGSRSKIVKASLYLNGKTAEIQATCTQAGDPGASDQVNIITSGGAISYSAPTTSGFTFSSFSKTLKAASNVGTGTTEYSAVTVSDFSYPDVPAAGGTAMPTGLSYSQTKTETRSSTSAKSITVTATVKYHSKEGTATATFTQPGDAGQASSTTDVTSFTVKYSASYKSGFTLNSSATGEVKWTSYTSTTSDRTNDVKVTVTGGGSKSGSKTATSKQLKKEAAPVVLSSLTFNVNKTNLVAGEATTYTLTAKYSDGSTADITSSASATVTSSNSSMLSASGGSVQSNKKIGCLGTFTLTAEYGGQTASKDVTVNTDYKSDDIALTCSSDAWKAGSGSVESGTIEGFVKRFDDSQCYYSFTGNLKTTNNDDYPVSNSLIEIYDVSGPTTKKSTSFSYWNSDGDKDIFELRYLGEAVKTWTVEWIGY